MAIQVEHEIHKRRRGRNLGVGLLLVAFIGIVFGLTVVKVLQLGDLRKFETFDHVVRPQILPDSAETTDQQPEVSN
ncbi:hypothetical protein [Loktanella sp. R86503]|uniref:hypothetical protein n=1 Tax=Loktanella sp. R86503 TaxID=3093847 RepID=UPI0036DC01B1